MREIGLGGLGESTRLEINKRRIRVFYEEVVNRGDAGKLSDFVAPSLLEQMKAHLQAVRSTYPDLNLEVGRQIAEGEWVVTCVIARGTHLGCWLGLESSGKTVEISGVNVDRLENGLIVEHGGAANTLDALLESGILEVPLGGKKG
jgi:predicted ester cyclase